MNVVNVNITNGSYPINIESGRLDYLDQSIPEDATSIAIVTNSTVGGLYGKRVRDVLLRTGKNVFYVELPDGEKYKDWITLNKIFDSLLNFKLDRKAVLLALGGGVIGDITGFAASLYMRGIRFIQVPTTILAQVDSSVGGKTAINHPIGKNMIGSFYQPISVEIDTDVLTTLSPREISAGLAEVVKYGLILDSSFWEWCENNVNNLLSLDDVAIEYAIKRSCELKSYIVGKDEKESGIRAILNLGHTFGHAIESGLGYGKWLHGEAVGCGLVQAAELSGYSTGFKETDIARVRYMISSIGCPFKAPNFGLSRWLELMLLDKKNENGEIRFVLMKNIGETVIQNVSHDAIEYVIAKTVTSKI
ncbi:3-dehydroquinate synthase [Candidatus Kinetoplastibacterium oncopeltii TCC290E]|uniref:3-dehydroquinate synthase n=1 Tax=Candidatus Kinetoplastidibacterium stringomonadis TCC290E TaxID=1208920 RepID=M1LX76_9PROT|nr:3-dehydroquinate synthase [Candidatus Kinetoplastibacterium oncopeltii]AGF48671.1 3-dehydroquinate synthase [Candidatus Kinetoplastibacterium oncopeltii TCC290E]